MTNILYIADPNSIHDQKWMTWFSEQETYKCYLICRTEHQTDTTLNNITFLGSLKDYSILKPWQNTTGRQLLEKSISEYNIDLIHIFYAEPNLLWVNALKQNTPVILTTRGSDVLIGLKHFISQNTFISKRVIKAYQTAFDKVKAITSTSQRQADFLTAHFKLNRSPEIVRTGLDISKIKQPQAKKNLIFFSRNMRPLYNHELALQAIVRLPKSIIDQYQFVFIDRNSKDQTYVSLIEGQMKTLDHINIVFKDAMSPDDYYDTLSKSVLVVMTPESDGAPVSGMEAIAAGAKLVLPQLNYDNDLFSSAFFYKPNTIEDLTAQILKALEDQSEPNLENYLPKVDRNVEMRKVKQLYQTITQA